MSKSFRPLLAFLILAIVILACDLPIPPVPGLPTPGASTPVLPASPDPNKVGTAVAATLTAMVPGGDFPTPPAATPQPTGDGSTGTGLLPATLYYLAPDGGGVIQVFRMLPDGATRNQVTAETVNVTDYDVSRIDGSVAYVVNNTLFYINADGSERRELVDGGPMDPNNPFVSALSSPVFSLDGQTLAYGYKGLQLYSFATDESQLVLENRIDEIGDGLYVPDELYEPERYSPDGTKLLINLAYYEGGSSAIYYPATNALVRLTGGEGAFIWGDANEWSADSSSIYAASSTSGMFSSGLWRIDAATGEVTTLLPGNAGDGTYNAAQEAYLAPDGQLYFFFATVSSPEGIFERAPLQLVRSGPDGLAGRAALSAEDFQLLNEALWAPDASLVVVAIAPSPEIYQGGQAKIVHVDGTAGADLVPFAVQMKWGP